MAYQMAAVMVHQMVAVMVYLKVKNSVLVVKMDQSRQW